MKRLIFRTSKRACHVAGQTPRAAFFGALLMGDSTQVRAEDHFDAGLLTINGTLTAETVDLSQFSAAGSIPEGQYLVSIILNEKDKGHFNVNFARNHQGYVTPVFTPALLNEWGVNTEGLPAFVDLPSDEPLADLPALIPHASSRFDFSLLRLTVSVPQIAMKANSGSHVSAELWDDGVPAMVMNYTLNGGKNWQQSQSGNSEQTSLFAHLNGGVNWQAWRLRSDFSYSQMQSANRHFTSRYQTSTFNSVYLQRDIKSLKSDLIIGESSTDSEIFDSIPFLGVRLSSSLDMLPPSMRGFAPVIEGIAETTARITVSQNGSVVYQTYVAPGPFKINDLYQTGQSGDMTVTITEADGRVRQQSLAYSTLPVMLRPGRIRYDVTSGRYNGGVTYGSEQSRFTLATLTYGLTIPMTVYGGGLVGEEYLSGVVGSGFSLRSWGALSTDVTVADAKKINKQGSSWRVRYSKSMLSTGTLVDLAAYRYSTRNYYSFADVNNLGYQLRGDLVPWALARKRSSMQLRISQDLGHYGSIYFSGAHEDYWGRSRINNSISAGYNTSLYGVSYGVTWSLDRTRGEGSWPVNQQISLNLQVPLRLFSQHPALSNATASMQMTRSSGNYLQQQLGLNGTALDDKASWSLNQGVNNQGGGDSSSLAGSFVGNKGMMNAGYSHSRSVDSLNVGGSGGLVVHAGGVTFSQALGNSVAVVHTPGASGISLMQGNVETDGRGYAVVPYLANYQRNDLTVDTTSLPEDVEMTHSSQQVYPTRGAVVTAGFDTRIGHQVLMTLTRKGNPVPFGASVTLAHHKSTDGYTSVVGEGGQVYLSGMPEKGRLKVSWGNSSSRQCQTDYDLSKVKKVEGYPLRQLEAPCL